IMTDSDGIEVADRWDELTEELHRLGCWLDSPFMTLSFMALIVIPELKIGEKGLFEYSSFRFLSE
ncbi:MAG: adenine deaminase, partial [Odoribacter sp.]|nr:adenine deaminase [Odoribacter sp.]